LQNWDAPFVDWTDNQEQRLQRQRWLNVLSAGENPFTEEEIESLFNEYNVANLEELDEIEVCQDQLSSSQASRNLAGVGDIEGESALSSSTPVVCDRLSCESGIDYTRLRDLLSAGQWLEADLETKAIMLKIPDREAEGWLREEDIKNFPCTDLLIIDNLWVEYSQGRFGFSVQKEIWESVGGKKNADYEIYCLFCKRIGWGDRLGYRDFSWLSSCDLTFNTRAPVGHLPGGLLDWLWSSYRKSRLSLLVESADGTATSTPVWWNIIPSIASRLSECYIQSSAPTAVAQQRLVTTVSNKPGEGFLGEFLIHNKFVRIYQGDITNLVTDVIVSSDDTSLKMNGGVSWKIREVGGEEIYRETRNLIPLSLGNVAVTTAGKLQAKKIFHGVVMDWHHEILPSQNVIRQVVRTCIEMANQYGFKSIAFPLLGTGAGGFSAKIAWESIVLQIIRELSDKNQNSPEVVIVLYEKIIVKELNVESFLERINKSGWRLLVMHRRGETF
jgi:O-acetyl-ADP-ribose deacetylase (regulator of RNase III)